MLIGNWVDLCLCHPHKRQLSAQTLHWPSTGTRIPLLVLQHSDFLLASHHFRAPVLFAMPWASIWAASLLRRRLTSNYRLSIHLSQKQEKKKGNEIKHKAQSDLYRATRETSILFFFFCDVHSQWMVEFITIRDSWVAILSSWPIPVTTLFLLFGFSFRFPSCTLNVFPKERGLGRSWRSWFWAPAQHKAKSLNCCSWHCFPWPPVMEVPQSHIYWEHL